MAVSSFDWKGLLAEGTLCWVLCQTVVDRLTPSWCQLLKSSSGCSLRSVPLHIVELGGLSMDKAVAPEVVLELVPPQSGRFYVICSSRVVIPFCGMRFSVFPCEGLKVPCRVESPLMY